LGAIVVQPLNQLTGISGVLVAQVRIDDLRVQFTLELLLRPEPPPGPMRTTESVVSCSTPLTV
jgi:hypothetical protein